MPVGANLPSQFPVLNKSDARAGDTFIAYSDFSPCVLLLCIAEGCRQQSTCLHGNDDVVGVIARAVRSRADIESYFRGHNTR